MIKRPVRFKINPNRAGMVMALVGALLTSALLVPVWLQRVAVETAPRKGLDVETITARLPYDMQECRPDVVGENVLAVCGTGPRFAVILVRQDGTAMVRLVMLDGTR